MRILLTSPRAPVALDLARRFRLAGDEVYLCECLRFCSGRFSRAATRFYLTPAPRTNPKTYIQAINDIIKKNQIDLLVPTCEEVFYVAAYKDQIECDVFVSELQSLKTLHNKWTFSQTIDDVSVRVPSSVRISSASDLEPFKKRCHEFVFKPVYSRFASETLIGPSTKQLDRISISETKPWIAQQLVSGKEVSTYSIARNGRLLAHCSYRSLFRAGVGAGICFEAEPNDVITEFTARFVEKFNFTGQIGFDFIIDSNDQVWALEANPRATSGLHLFEENGLLVDAIKGSASERLLEPDDQTCKQVAVAMMSFGLKDAVKKNQLGLYLRKLIASPDIVFRWSDPVPFLALPLTLGELYWIAVRNRMSLQQATTADIQWDGEAIFEEAS